MSAATSRRRLVHTVGVLLLAATTLLATGCDIQPNDHTLPGQVAVGDDGYRVSVHFDQIENLVPNSTVQKDNVVIGTVGRIDVEGWEAVVQLHLLDSVRLPANTTFAIGQKTLLGAQYVEVSEPSGPSGPSEPAGAELRPGAVIGVEQTGAYPATERVLGAVALLLNNGGLSQISTITGQLGTALRSRVPDTRSLVRRAGELLEVLDANRGEIVSALRSLERLSRGLRADRGAIGTAIDRIAPGLQVLEAERARLVKALTHTGRASSRAADVVRVSEGALLANLDSLAPILANLSKVSRSLPEALKLAVTIPFPAMTTSNAVRGDYANLFATIDLSATGLASTWLGGLSPALQSGDPVDTPLAPSPGTSSSTPAPQPVPDAVPAPQDPADAPSTRPAPPSCLLRILGLC